MKAHTTTTASPRGGSKRAHFVEPTVGTNGHAIKAARMKATKPPPKPSEPEEPDEAASSAVVALIRFGDDARSLFDALWCFAAELEGTSGSPRGTGHIARRLGIALAGWAPIS